MEVKRKLNGKLYKLKLITKNIDELMFNPFNTRIYDLIKSNKDLENFEVSSDNSSLHNIQNVIYDRLKRNFGISENSEIVDSIKADGVQEKMIIMPNGILLSGNNRLSIIKNLIERNQWVHGDGIEVFEMEENLSKEEILLIELELQNIQSKQLMYDVINNVRRAKQLLDGGEDLKRVQSLTNLKNFNRSYIETFDKCVVDMSKFYETNNILEKIYDAKIYSFLDLCTTLLNNSKIKNNNKISKAIKTIFMEIMFFTNVTVLDVRFVVNGILKMEQGLKEEMLFDFERFISSTYGVLADNFVEKMKNDDNYVLMDFQKDFSKELYEVNEKFSQHISNLQFEIREIVKTQTVSKRSPFDIDVNVVSKTNDNLEKAKILIEDLQKWLEK